MNSYGYAIGKWLAGFMTPKVVEVVCVVGLIGITIGIMVAMLWLRSRID